MAAMCFVKRIKKFAVPFATALLAALIFTLGTWRSSEVVEPAHGSVMLTRGVVTGSGVCVA